MSFPVIQVENLSKRYVISHQTSQADNTLRDTITSGFKSLGRRLLPSRKQIGRAANQEEFWALKEVSFKVQQGEIIGIIGRNGAGKSTILKLLSRITEPTMGRIIIDGRVASLLEVGTGFHSELTGRENIYLNGAILGMTKAEISRKFDMIVAFAEIEKFLDTPVKRYSSGMYVRLAFAVAAHVEPDILIVDEVLAVGDNAFQQKCLGKMEHVANQKKRTVLFVSHNMETVQALCHTVYHLDGGRIVASGKPYDVINRYLESMAMTVGTQGVALRGRADLSLVAGPKIVSISIEDADRGDKIRCNSRLKISIGYQSTTPLVRPQFSATVFDSLRGVGILEVDSSVVGGIPETLPYQGTVTCITEPLYLTPGRCYVNLDMSIAGVEVDEVQHAAYFDIEHFDIFGGGHIPERDWTICLKNHSWSFSE